MNTKQKKRLIGIIIVFILLGSAAALILFALKQNINLFYTPTELKQSIIQADQVIRVGGYVKKNSVRFNSSGQNVIFTVTDRSNDIKVNYSGMLPNLFREGQVVIVTGKLKTGSDPVLNADQVLAKHDEKYMPRPLAEKLRDKNHDS